MTSVEELDPVIKVELEEEAVEMQNIQMLQSSLNVSGVAKSSSSFRSKHSEEEQDQVARLDDS